MHKFIPGFLLSVSLACLSPIASASSPVQADMAGAVAKPFELSCGVGNGLFQGYVKGHYYNYGSSKGIYITQSRSIKTTS